MHKSKFCRNSEIVNFRMSAKLCKKSTSFWNSEIANFRVSANYIYKHCGRVGGWKIAPADEDELRRHFPEMDMHWTEDSWAKTQTKTHRPQTNAPAQTNSLAKTKTKRITRRRVPQRRRIEFPREDEDEDASHADAKTKTKTRPTQTNSPAQTTSLAKTKTRSVKR